MTESAIPALRSLRDQALWLASSLSDAEWNLASDCSGWSVRDLYAHMGGVLHGVVDPAFMRAGDDPNDMEAGMEVGVAERRSWPIAEVVSEYEAFSAQAIDNFAALQGSDMGAMEIPMGNLGTHPLHLLANAFVFDAYCHLRNDLLAPYGPLDRPAPAASAEHLGPIMDWMIAGLPQMCAAELTFMDAPVMLELVGDGGGAHLVGPEGGAPRATITTTPDAFVRWGTRRRPWRDEGVSIAGDEAYAAKFCDATNVI
jgi:uncharacterized protein (TIGR03083 family)